MGLLLGQVICYLLRYLTDTTLWTDLYCKPTDSHSYLHYSSAHPLHCKKGLPYSQLLSVECICSRDSDFELHAGMILYHFQLRGYPDTLLEHALQKVSQIDQSTLLGVTDNLIRENEDITALTTMYIPQFNVLPQIVKKNWDLLRRSSTTKKLADSKLIISYKRPKNLMDILVQAKVPLKKDDSEPSGLPLCENVNKCKNKSGNCRYCQNLNTS